MSKSKILKTMLEALSVIVSVVKTIEKMGMPSEPDGKTERKG